MSPAISLYPLYTVLLLFLVWASEEGSYTYEQMTCADVCGNYVQMVVADLEYVGCSLYDRANCTGSGIQIICDYSASPQLGQAPYVSGEACSGCAGEYPQCNNGLCALRDPVTTGTPTVNVSSTTTATTATTATVGTTSNATKCSFFGLLLIVALLAILSM